MTIGILQRSRDDYFYLNFPAATGDVYVSSDRIVVTPWLLEGLRLSELRAAALRLRHRYDEDAGWAQWATDDDGAMFDVFDASPAEYWDLDEDVPLPLDAELLAGRSGVRIRVIAMADASVDDERIEALATTAASRMRGRVRSIERLWENTTGVGWAIEGELCRRSALATELLRFGAIIAATVSELSGSVAPDAVINVIEAGFPDALVGLAESEWLEAKSQPWNLDAEYGKVELAQDVASLANASGGVIVLGARTHKVDGEETITHVDGIDPVRFSPHRARMVIDARVYPPVIGLAVRRAAITGSHLAVGYIMFHDRTRPRTRFLFMGQSSVPESRVPSSRS
jgi:hypothetical protein